MLTVEYGSATDQGPVRNRNEDCVLAEPRIFAVADGMGGHAAGDVAASLAVARLRDLAGRADLKPEDVRAAIDCANADILASSAGRDERTGMATTVSGLCVVRVGGADHWVAFNVGDSRVYRLAGGELSQISVDHSEVEELVTAGRLTRDEARWHPLRNIVTRSLGTNPAPTADLWVFPPTPGERFMVCSDGLPLELDDTEIRQLLTSVGTAQQAADLLVSQAVTAGGRDNVTAIVIDLVSAGSSSDADVVTVPRALLGEAQ